MKGIIRFVIISALLVLGLVATPLRAQNNVLAQLGASGVTDQIHGTNATLYAGFLTKLDSSGQLHSTLIPPTADTAVPLAEMMFVDSVNGGDTNIFFGTIVRPYKSFAYAVQQAESNDTIFVFMPGDYTATSITNINNMVLMGFDSERTTMSGTLQFAVEEDVIVTVVNMAVATIRQQKFQALTVNLYDRAKVTNQINRQNPTSTNSWLTLKRDPSITLANPIATTNSTETLTFNATDTGYTSGDTNDWWAAIVGDAPITVAAALDQLATRLVDGAAVGQLTRWNGTNWVPIAAGTTNQFLIGGLIPAWEDRILWPGTNIGQIVYWNGTNWTHIIAGSSNQVLFGSSPGDSKPVFRRWDAVYTAVDVPYAGSTVEVARITGSTNNTPADVSTALDFLFTNAIPRGTASGQLAYWNSTNWIVGPTSDVSQVLFGGSQPAWSNITLVPDGTVVGQSLEWDTTNWVAVNRETLPVGTDIGDLIHWNGTNWVEVDKGSAVEVLWGGVDPQFRSPTWLGLGTNDVISTGTVDGQMMYWSTTSNAWLHVPAGGTNEILMGGAVPRWVSSTNFVTDTLNGVDVGTRWYTTGTTNVWELFSGVNKITLFFD
jgi:hypothetical protein